MNALAARAMGLGALTLLGSACQPQDPSKPPPALFHLEGSVTQVMDLGYDEARLVYGNDDVAVIFVRRRPMNIVPEDGGFDSQATGEDYAFQVAWARLGADFPFNMRVDLAEAISDTSTAQRGKASRNVLNDPRKILPRFQRGTLALNGTLQPGTIARGDFNVTFENGIEVASGRTVFGHFEAKVIQ